MAYDVSQIYIVKKMNELIKRGLTNKRESKYVEFKESFDPNSNREWCEIIKDIVALANSGGGIIVFGLSNTGLPNNSDLSEILELDPAKVADRIKKYIGIHTVELEIHESLKQNCMVAMLLIQSAEYPVVFEKPGTYPVIGGKQESAFSQGTVYFRHGAKSEPGNTEDIRKHFEKKIEKLRKTWMEGVRKVIDAPIDHQVTAVPREVVESDSSEAVPIRITDDPNAPVIYKTNLDISYPYRQKELINKLNISLPEGICVNSYDIRAVRRVYDIDNDTKYSHQPKYSTRQYSEAFIDFILEKYNKNEKFFQITREELDKNT